MRPQRVASLPVTWEVMKLPLLLDWPLTYEQVQSLCCPGLLEVADTDMLLALLDGVTFNPVGRAVKAAVPVTAGLPAQT